MLRLLFFFFLGIFLGFSGLALAQSGHSQPAYILVKDSLTQKELVFKNSKLLSLEIKGMPGYVQGPFIIDGNTLVADSVQYFLDDISYFRYQTDLARLHAFIAVIGLPINVPLALLTGNLIYMVGAPALVILVAGALPVIYAGYTLLEAHGHFFPVSAHFELEPGPLPAAGKRFPFF